MFRYNKNDRLWIMRHARKAEFLATSRASEDSLLLGSHLWVVHNDSYECADEQGTSYTTNLTLHACEPEQFACGNAFCIAMEKRCNVKEDCLDGSDEQNCGKVMLREGYKKELAPLTDNGDDVIVDFFLNMFDIEISEPTETFISKISFTRNWFDWRLLYKNLKNMAGSKLNTLLTSERKAIWYPRVAFYNVRSADDVKKTEIRRDILEVIPHDEFAFLARDNMHIFEGSKNALSLTKEFNIKWKCGYDYHWYPFDTQVCRMEFASTDSNIILNPSNLQYNNKISLSCYAISEIRMCKSVIAEMRAIVIEVTLERPIVNFLLTVFVPTILLVIISFTARFFVEDYIDMVIQVNLTILLVLGTM